jgi:amino acid transporter
LEEHFIPISWLGTAAIAVYYIFYILTNIACAYYIYQDAIKQDRRPLNIHPYWWAAFGAIGGIWVLVGYWLMQHSSLRKSESE